jgi:hypothetical protein
MDMKDIDYLIREARSTYNDGKRTAYATLAIALMMRAEFDNGGADEDDVPLSWI